MASQSENCSSLLGVAYLYSLKRCCFRFFFSFTFSLARARACIDGPVLVAFHRSWDMDEGGNNLGIVVAVGRTIEDRLSLAIEAMHWAVEAMVGGVCGLCDTVTCPLAAPVLGRDGLHYL